MTPKDMALKAEIERTAAELQRRIDGKPIEEVGNYAPSLRTPGDGSGNAARWQAAFGAALGDERAAALWHCAVEAAHDFARATGCPAGGNVFVWISDMTEAANAAGWEAVRRPDPKGEG